MSTTTSGTHEQDDLIRSEPDEFHLACLLLSPTATDYLGDALARVDPEDFYDNALSALWRYARIIHGRGERITRRTLMIQADTEAAESQYPVIQSRQLLSWLERCDGYPAHPERVPGSIKAVTQTAQLRRLVLAAEQIKTRAVRSEDYSQAYGWATQLIAGLAEVETSDRVLPFSELVDEWHVTMTRGLVAGQVVPTPWVEVNEIFGGGLHAGRAYVIAGRPGAGKSNGGLNIAAGAAEQGFHTLVVSAEMSSFEVTGRLLAAGGRAEYSEIAQYAMSPDTQDRVTEYGHTYRDMPLWVVDQPGMTVEKIEAMATAMSRRGGLDLLVVDYLQLVEPSDPRSNRERVVSHISRSLKLLAKRLGCAVVAMAQLSRDNAKAARRPGLADLRESGSIEQDCDGAILLHHDRTPDDYPTGLVTLIIAKNRFGRTGDVDLAWKGYQARIGA